MFYIGVLDVVYFIENRYAIYINMLNYNLFAIDPSPIQSPVHHRSTNTSSPHTYSPTAIRSLTDDGPLVSVLGEGIQQLSRGTRTAQGS